jgi:hypothetical protein
VNMRGCASGRNRHPGEPWVIRTSAQNQGTEMKVLQEKVLVHDSSANNAGSRCVKASGLKRKKTK